MTLHFFMNNDMFGCIEWGKWMTKKKPKVKKQKKIIFAYAVWRERENIPSTCVVCKRKKKSIWHYTLMDIFNNF